MNSLSTLVVQNSVALHWKPFNPSLNVSFSRKKIINSNCSSSCAKRLGGFGNNSLTISNKTNKRRFVANSIDGGNPSSSGASSGWVLGIVISVILPFFTHKLGPLEIWKKKFDVGLQRIEDTVEEGEKIAVVVEKEAEKWLDRLPVGWFKDALAYIEQGAEKTAKFLSNVDDAIDEFQEEEEKIEKCMESTTEVKAKDAEEDEKK
ncbi:hypothetical protein Leryth_014026 [Lithospermum erythrorhizon]|nr:hypothetical protein Leryth_014026 [Lithospermum erythrorhizon]